GQSTRSRRSRQSGVNTWAPLFIFIALSACGGGGADQPPPGPATVSTLAYVVTECSTDAAQGPGTIRQRLQIRRGDQAPITVVDTSAVGFTDGRFCWFVGAVRADYQFAQYGVFHRLGVSPDGSQVVFEVTDDDGGDTGVPPPARVVPDEQKGTFAVRADGTNLRLLGPASRESSFQGNGEQFFVFTPTCANVATIH